MAKSKSPYRIDENLMHLALIAGATQHRKPIEQLEYWAELGRKVEQHLSMDSLYQVSCGFVRLKAEPTANVSVDPKSVFDALESDRERGALSTEVPPGTVRYQASVTNPGRLEAVYPEGQVVVGAFRNGLFEPDRA